MVETFCLRLACGLVLALLVLSPAQVPPRFYRVQFLTALGLLAVAAFFLRDQADAVLWLALGAGMFCCFVGSVVWHLDEAPGGRILIGLAPPVLVACLILGGQVSRADAASPWFIADDLASA